MNNRTLTFFNIASFVIFLLFSSCQSVKVKNNERGVIFKKFDGGVDTSKVYLPGKYSIAKHDRLILYNIDPKFGEENLTLLSKDEVGFELKLSYSFNPILEKVAHLHDKIGSGYHQSVVKPAIRVTAKEQFKKYPANEISLLDKQKLADQLLRTANEMSTKNYVQIEAIQVEELIQKN